MYDGGEVQKDLIPLSTLHMMTSSHSQFLPTMLDSSEELSSCQAKGMISSGEGGLQICCRPLMFYGINEHILFLF